MGVDVFEGLHPILMQCRNGFAGLPYTDAKIGACIEKFESGLPFSSREKLKIHVEIQSCYMFFLKFRLDLNLDFCATSHDVVFNNQFGVGIQTRRQNQQDRVLAPLISLQENDPQNIIRFVDLYNKRICFLIEMAV